MASSSSRQPHDPTDGIVRPRPIKPGNPVVLRAQGENGSHRANGGPLSRIDMPNSGLSSGRSTPLPPDAPPSAVSLSSARKQIRAQQKHRLFPTIDYAARVSHFDPKSDYRDFRGFFVLFWIGLAIMVITTMLRNIKDTGFPFRVGVWALLTERVWQLALSDGAMIVSTSLSLPLHKLFRNSKRWLWWEKAGMPIQSVYQAAWFTLWVNWPFMFGWTWTAQVFFTLHSIVMLMKMHSYAFYNGHLSTTEHRLSALDNPKNASTEAAVRYPSSSSDLNELNTLKEKRAHQDEEDAIAELREDLAIELTSPLGSVTYPQNLTLYNYADYILCPTLCYELEYPRTERTQYLELFWKTLAVFGCIFLLTITSEEFIVPVLHDASLRLNDITSTSETLLVLLESISLLLFPFMVTFLLVFLVIFEYVLGAFAEITCFADRRFYSDWWNSCDWLEFSREWNIPVHHFLRRHVYGASRPYMSRNMSTLVTFLISAFGHELVMSCITKKLRGYGFLAQMLQLPIVALQRTKVVRGKRLFNNISFWISIILGLSMMCALYVLV
ncbi:Sterol O-acyltransferase 2 (Sterol-ester synthase 2) [Xanthoria parietina]